MREVFAPADDIADGEMYLKLAADIEDRITELKNKYKATKDTKVYYAIQDLKRIQREHQKTALHLLYRGERRRCEKGEIEWKFFIQFQYQEEKIHRRSAVNDRANYAHRCGTVCQYRHGVSGNVRTHT